MTTNHNPVYVVVSYWPLLMGPAGAMHELKSEDVKALSEFIEKSPSGSASGCLWVEDDGVLSPVFLFENADAIYEHLLVWSENEPEKWFEFVMSKSDDKYAIVCFPQLQKSVERWKITYQLITGFPVHPEAKFHILFQPLTFVSQNMGVFAKLGDRLKDVDKFRIGFMNWAKDGPPSGPVDIDDDAIRWIEIPKAKTLSTYEQYMKGIFDK